MSRHEHYVKRLLAEVAGSSFVGWGPELRVKHKDGTWAMIDGVIRDFCAVRIESHTNEQIRGALIDLLSHHLPRKLLVIVPTYMRDPLATAKECQCSLGILAQSVIRPKIVLIAGSRNTQSAEADEVRRNVLVAALRDLGWRQRTDT